MKTHHHKQEKPQRVNSDMLRDASFPERTGQTHEQFFFEHVTPFIRSGTWIVHYTKNKVGKIVATLEQK